MTRSSPLAHLTHAVAGIPKLVNAVAQAPAAASRAIASVAAAPATATRALGSMARRGQAEIEARVAPAPVRSERAAEAAARKRATRPTATPAPSYPTAAPRAAGPTAQDRRLHAEAMRRMQGGDALEDLPPVYRKAYLSVERAVKGPERAARNNQNHARARDAIADNAAQSTTAAQLNRQIKEDKAILVASKSDPNPIVRGLATVTDATSFGLAEKANDQIDVARAHYAEQRARGDRSWGTAAAGLAVEVGDSFGVNRIFDHRSSIAQTGDGITNLLVTTAGGPLIGKTAGLVARTRPMAAANTWMAATRPGAALNAAGRALVKPRALPAPLASAAEHMAATGPGQLATRVAAELEKPRALPFTRPAPAAPAAPAYELVHEPPADPTQFVFGEGSPVRLKGYVATDADRAAFRASDVGRNWDYAHMEATRPAGTPVLPAEEAAALLEYTGDGYRQLNKALWTNHPTFMAEQENMAKLVSSALGRAPAHQGVVYRGASLSEAQAAQYQVGEVVTHRSFGSSTTDPSKIAPYQSGNGVKMEYQIQSSTGRDITGLTAHEIEDEILFQPGAQFRVTGVERSVEAGGRPFMRVQMSEL